jgi:hypothetical protein
MAGCMGLLGKGRPTEAPEPLHNTLHTPNKPLQPARRSAASSRERPFPPFPTPLPNPLPPPIPGCRRRRRSVCGDAHLIATAARHRCEPAKAPLPA